MSMTAVQGIVYRNVCNSHNCEHHARMAERVESQILIQQRHDRERAMFGGAEARKLLGLPQGQDCRVRPGNHGNFDLFVQSTSVNRKLVRGTTVVHWPLILQ